MFNSLIARNHSEESSTQEVSNNTSSDLSQVTQIDNRASFRLQSNIIQMVQEMHKTRSALAIQEPQSQVKDDVIQGAFIHQNGPHIQNESENTLYHWALKGQYDNDDVYGYFYPEYDEWFLSEELLDNRDDVSMATFDPEDEYASAPDQGNAELRRKLVDLAIDDPDISHWNAIYSSGQAYLNIGELCKWNQLSPAEKNKLLKIPVKLGKTEVVKLLLEESPNDHELKDLIQDTWINEEDNEELGSIGLPLMSTGLKYANIKEGVYDTERMKVFKLLVDYTGINENTMIKYVNNSTGRILEAPNVLLNWLWTSGGLQQLVAAISLDKLPDFKIEDSKKFQIVAIQKEPTRGDYKMIEDGLHEVLKSQHKVILSQGNLTKQNVFKMLEQLRGLLLFVEGGPKREEFEAALRNE